jgi:hypothetical protein
MYCMYAWYGIYKLYKAIGVYLQIMSFINYYVQLCENAFKCQIQMTIEKKSINIKLKSKRNRLCMKPRA